MLNFSFFTRPFYFSTKKEEWTSDDMRLHDTFVTSALCITEEKALRNRIAALNDIALSNVGTVKAEIAQGKMEELADILLEWKNLRDDLSNKPTKNV